MKPWPEDMDVPAHRFTPKSVIFPVMSLEFESHMSVSYSASSVVALTTMFIAYEIYI